MFPEQYITCWHQSFEWFRKQTLKSVGWKCSTESSIMNIQTYLSTQSYWVDEYVIYSCILPVLYNLYFYVLFYIVSSLWLNFGFMGVAHIQLTPIHGCDAGPADTNSKDARGILRNHHRPFRQQVNWCISQCTPTAKNSLCPYLTYCTTNLCTSVPYWFSGHL